VQGLQANPMAIAFVLLFAKIGQYSKAISLAKERSNLSLLAMDEAVVGTRRAAWFEQPADMTGTSSNRWVTWIDGDTEGDKPTKRAQLLLGDFKVFGDFLQELIGSSRQPEKEPDAK